jgi:hypothetical protein
MKFARLKIIFVLTSQLRKQFKVGPHKIHDLGQFSRVVERFETLV